MPPFYQSSIWRSQHEELEKMDITNTSDQTASNHSHGKDGEKEIQNTDAFAQRKGSDKNKPAHICKIRIHGPVKNFS